MGVIVASCGHELTEEENFGKGICTWAYDREMNKCLEYGSVCDKCYEFYQKAGALVSEEQQSQFLKNDTP